MCTRIAVISVALFFSGLAATGSQEAEPAIEVIGPPSRFMEDITRYTQPPAWRSLPIQVPVTRQSYLGFIAPDSSYGVAAIAKNPDRGLYGPRHAFPALAQYDASGDPRQAGAIKTCLRHFDAAVRDVVRQRKWHECYMHEPTLLCMYRKVFKSHGCWSEEDERWFKELFLWLNRTVHVWGGPECFWRGPMHRATGEGIMKLLAATMYPDAPEAAEWRRYAELQWNDWWQFRDNPINDTGYFNGQVFPIIVGSHLLGRKEVFTDRQMREFWDRLVEMTTPDGAVVPFGPSSGWNSQAGERLMALEFAAAYTGDGRYRFVAHRIFNNLLYQRDVLIRNHMLDHFSQLGCALAYFVADDTIQPVQPSVQSTILYHKETLRVRNKVAAKPYLADLDPDPLKAHVDCGLLCTSRTVPFKLCMRSGWTPGDMYMLVDLFPRHEPMNPSGILGLTRYNSAMACAVDSKGVTDWLNMMKVDDLSGRAPRVKNTNPGMADAYYMEVTVSEFTDHPAASYARVEVKDYNGFPMTLRRDFFFIKNRFVLLRDTAVFRQGFAARLGPTWYTQNIGPQIGPSWANTYFGTPISHGEKLHNPPMDLLVYHAPRPDRRLQILDETADVRRLAMPLTLRYVWEGEVKPGEPYCFAQLLYPTIPKRAPVRSNNPGAASLDQVLGRSPAIGVTVLRDTPLQTAWRICSEEDREEWVVLNDDKTPIEAEGLKTDARRIYLELCKGKPVRVLINQGTRLSLHGAELWRADKRSDYAK